MSGAGLAEAEVLPEEQPNIALARLNRSRSFPWGLLLDLGGTRAANQAAFWQNFPHYTMTTVILITGNTFTSRRELKALGGKWYPDQTGWIVPVTQQSAAEKIAVERGFSTGIIEIEDMPLERPTGERLRAIRQAKLDRRAERLNARADRLEKLAAAETSKVTQYDDFAFWTQPILIGHHSEKSHRRLRDRLSASMSKSVQYANEAQELRAAAAPVKARIAGDAEQRRQMERDSLDKLVTIGSRVMDFSFGEGTVVRVHKKSYTVKYDRGFQYSRDKSYFRLLPT